MKETEKHALFQKETIEMMMQKMQILSKSLHKEIYIQMFGRFNVLKSGVPIALRGKAKEILALVATRCGKEISNEEIYSVIWEGREYSNVKMKVYYNALKRLKEILEAEGLSDLLLPDVEYRYCRVRLLCMEES